MAEVLTFVCLFLVFGAIMSFALLSVGTWRARFLDSTKLVHSMTGAGDKLRLEITRANPDKIRVGEGTLAFQIPRTEDGNWIHDAEGRPAFKPWVLYAVRDGQLKRYWFAEEDPGAEVSDQALAQNSAAEVLAENVTELKSRQLENGSVEVTLVAIRGESRRVHTVLGVPRL